VTDESERAGVRKKLPGRRPLPEHLPRREIFGDPDEPGSRDQWPGCGDPRSNGRVCRDDRERSRQRGVGRAAIGQIVDPQPDDSRAFALQQEAAATQRDRDAMSELDPGNETVG